MEITREELAWIGGSLTPDNVKIANALIKIKRACDDPSLDDPDVVLKVKDILNTNMSIPRPRPKRR